MGLRFSTKRALRCMAAWRLLSVQRDAPPACENEDQDVQLAVRPPLPPVQQPSPRVEGETPAPGTVEPALASPAPGPTPAPMPARKRQRGGALGTAPAQQRVPRLASFPSSLQLGAGRLVSQRRAVVGTLQPLSSFVAAFHPPDRGAPAGDQEALSDEEAPGPSLPPTGPGAGACPAQAPRASQADPMPLSAIFGTLASGNSPPRAPVVSKPHRSPGPPAGRRQAVGSHAALSAQLHSQRGRAKPLAATPPDHPGPALRLSQIFGSTGDVARELGSGAATPDSIDENVTFVSPEPAVLSPRSRQHMQSLPPHLAAQFLRSRGIEPGEQHVADTRSQPATHGDALAISAIFSPGAGMGGATDCSGLAPQHPYRATSARSAGLAARLLRQRRHLTRDSSLLQHYGSNGSLPHVAGAGDASSSACSGSIEPGALQASHTDVRQRPCIDIALVRWLGPSTRAAVLEGFQLPGECSEQTPAAPAAWQEGLHPTLARQLQKQGPVHLCRHHVRSVVVVVGVFGGFPSGTVVPSVGSCLLLLTRSDSRAPVQIQRLHQAMHEAGGVLSSEVPIPLGGRFRLFFPFKATALPGGEGHPQLPALLCTDLLTPL